MGNLKMQNLLQNKTRLVKTAVFLCLISFTATNIAWAEIGSTQELKEQQEKLRELLDSIGEAQDQRSQQRAMLRKLEKQMSCNWMLIQDYDACEKKYTDNLEAHLNCKQQARKKSTECLSNTVE